MLRLTLLAVGASLAIGVAAPQDAAAQSGRERAAARAENRDRDRDRDRDRNRSVVVRDRDRDRRDREVICVDRNGRRVACRYDDRWDDHKHKNKPGNGPKFCRNGDGHPVYGMAWCRDKGYSTGYGRYRRVSWEDVILRRPRHYDNRMLSRSILQDILGAAVLGRFDRQRTHLGYRQPLYGRWYESNEGSLLRLFSGNEVIAQIWDRNRDGRGDVILLYNGR